jgi:small conductance mechanosensitive channel
MPSLSARELTVDLLIRYGFQILDALVIPGAGLLLARYTGNLTARWPARRALEPPVRGLMVKVVRVVVLVFTLVLALDTFGFQVAPLVAGIGVAGLGIGIALQGGLGNLVAGLRIILTKPFRVEEWIPVVGVHGQVHTIELFATTLLHRDQSRVIIPNRKLIGEILHDYGTVRQLDLTAGVAYARDLGAALAAARETLLANPRVLETLAPTVGIASLGDSAINLSLRPGVAVPDYIAAQAELYRAVVERFRAAGIEIPFPQREVRLLGAA